jgi:hypothetical protein
MAVEVIKNQFALTKYILKNVRLGVGMTSSDKLVLLCLSDYMNANNGWYCYPSAAEISSVAAMSERNCFRVLDNLKKLGVITYEKGYKVNVGKNVANSYNIDMKVLSKLTGVPATLYGEVKNVKTVKNKVDEPVISVCKAEQHPDYDEEDGNSILDRPKRSVVAPKQQRDPCDLIDDPF